MKSSGAIFLLFCMGLCNFVQAQQGCGIVHTAAYLELVEMGKSKNKSRHFARLYAETEKIIDAFCSEHDSDYLNFTRRFAPLFTEKFAAHFADSGDPRNIWFRYAIGADNDSVSLLVSGIFAHVCGDLPLVLNSEFTLAELQRCRRSFKRENRHFDSLTSATYRSALQQYRKLRRIHRISLGTDIAVAKYTFHRWRRRAYRDGVKLKKKKFTEAEFFEKYFAREARLYKAQQRYIRN